MTRSVSQSPEVLLARRLGVLLALYALIRLFFLVYHRGQFDAASVGSILGAFVVGVRYDIVAIVYANIPFILLSLVPGPWSDHRYYQRLLYGVFLAINVASIIVMVADVGYYPFTGTRVTLDVFGLAPDASRQASQLIRNYAGITTVGALLALFIGWAYPKRRPEIAVPRRPWARQALVTIGCLAVLAIGARGGLQRKPLHPIHAFESGRHELGVLKLNSMFTLLRTPRRPAMQRVAYYATDAEAANVLKTPYGYAELAARYKLPKRQNIVVIMLESVGTEYWGAEDREVRRTPFLDSLAQHGVFYRQAFANGRRSMDALPSILLGVPLLMDKSVALSGFTSNEWHGVGDYLGRAGYRSAFYHGAPKGTMYFDALAGMAGIKQFHPLEDYPDSVRAKHFDGHWGLYDGPALQWDAEQIGRMAQPFFAMLFTISTHHPYQLPAEYVDSIPEGPVEIHAPLQYLDLSLRQFFERVRHEPWYQNTLFILTGDHTAPLRSERYDTDLGRFMVPILLFRADGKLPPMDTTRIVEHVDLFPTILDYAGVQPGNVPFFGKSLFGNSTGEAVLQSNGISWLVRKEGVLQMDPDGTDTLFTLEGERSGETPVGPEGLAAAPEMRARLNAYLQHYAAGLYGNAFYKPSAIASKAQVATQPAVPPLPRATTAP